MKERRDVESGVRRTIGYGYVGRWADGSIGWCLPGHLRGAVWFREPPSDEFNDNAILGRAVLCRITVEVVYDSLGREVKRRPKKLVQSKETTG